MNMLGWKYFLTGGASCWTVPSSASFNVIECSGCLLTVADVVVERHILAASLESASIIHHLGVEMVKDIVRYCIRDDDKAVFMNAADRRLEIPRAKPSG